jgi:hypothetical protein
MTFRNPTKMFFDKAQLYTQGILQSHRCNIEEISDTLLEPNYFQMQHFISDSNWSYRTAIDVAATQTSKSLPKTKLTGLIIDETGTEKKGDKSFGVGHQYFGNEGKTANSHVAVMGCLSNGDFASMIDLAYEMILHQLDLGTTFDYIAADGFYGNDCNLARKIDHQYKTWIRQKKKREYRMLYCL